MHDIQRTDWGQVNEKAVYLYTLTNDNGVVAKITNYGAILTELHVPDRNGVKADVVLGFDNLNGYLAGHPYFGCIVGRVANRIAGGRFTLNGKQYTLATNDGPNHLHGGEKGFDKKVWAVTDEGQAVGEAALTIASPDGEEGYPGALTASVTYTLTNEDTLKVEMHASTDAATIVNLANHSYWNLAGHDAGDILRHELTLNADKYTPTDATLIPTGEIAPVAGTPYDFATPKTIGADIDKLPGVGKEEAGGYDINFVLNGESRQMKLAAVATDPGSGRTMEVHTTEPGVQFYSGNFLDGSSQGKGGAVYNKYTGFCLETQHYPDAINKTGQPGWSSVVLRPGETYSHKISFQFSAE